MQNAKGKMTGGEVRVRVDELDVVGVNSLMVELSTGIEADCFEVRVPNVDGELTGLFVRPWEQKQQPPPTKEEKDKLYQGRRVDVEIAGELCFKGFCDSVDIGVIPDPWISMQGRDYTGLLIDEVVSPQLATAVSNVTSSVAVTRIANAFKLTPKVDRTSTVWDENQAFAAGTSVWSVVAELAGKEGFDAYVTAEKELVFKKRVMPGEISKTIVVPGDAGTRGRGDAVMELEFQTAKTMALGLKVRCVGHDPKRNRSIVFTAESPLRNRPNYKVIEVIDRSLRTKDQVSARAWAELLAISKNLITGRFRGPVDGKLRPGQAVEVKSQKPKAKSQSEEPLSGVYFVTKVRHRLTEDGEFTSEAWFASKPLAEGRIEEVERATEKSVFDLLQPVGPGNH